jgi:histidinol phosphatase-like PHP family hydrolase
MGNRQETRKASGRRRKWSSIPSVIVDLHAHTFQSDGTLLLSELVRRAETRGYAAIGVTDHVDASNIERVCRETREGALADRLAEKMGGEPER